MDEQRARSASRQLARRRPRRSRRQRRVVGGAVAAAREMKQWPKAAGGCRRAVDARSPPLARYEP